MSVAKWRVDFVQLLKTRFLVNYGIPLELLSIIAGYHVPSFDDILTQHQWLKQRCLNKIMILSKETRHDSQPIDPIFNWDLESEQQLLRYMVTQNGPIRELITSSSSLDQSDFVFLFQAHVESIIGFPHRQLMSEKYDVFAAMDEFLDTASATDKVNITARHVFGDIVTRHFWLSSSQSSNSLHLIFHLIHVPTTNSTC